MKTKLTAGYYLLAILICCGAGIVSAACAGGALPGKGNMENILAYYQTQGIMTNPGNREGFYRELPREIPSLVKIVQGVMAHVYMDPILGRAIPEARKKEVEIRTLEAKLEKISQLDSRPLKEARPFEKKLVSNCRDYSLFLCSLLRNQGYSARARCGFATYFTPGRFEDHWIVEYWDSRKNRWVKVDPQLTPEACQTFKLDFNPLDLPEGKFLSGSEVWLKCRKGENDPELCGIQHLKGLWFVRGDLIRDLMALNKLEILPWDCNELMRNDREPSAEDNQLLDEAASLVKGGDKTFPAMQTFYRSHPSFRMPKNWNP